MPDKNSTTAEKLGSLRQQFNTIGVDGFLIPRADEHQGEYVADYANRMSWISGFTGSAGTAIVLRDKAVVMTDGRYLIQVKNEVDAGSFDTENSRKVSAGRWIADHAGQDSIIGYDPKLHTPNQIKAIEKEVESKGITLKALDHNLVDMIWDDQPAPPKGAVELFPEKYAGMSAADKKRLVVDALRHEGAQGMAISLPDSVCWLLNIRGSDVDCNPVVLSNLLIDAENDALSLFVDPDKIAPDVRAALANDVTFLKPDELQGKLEDMAQAATKNGKPVLLDHARSSIWFKNILEGAGASVADLKDPCIDPRSTKTAAEQTAVRDAHITDGIAMVKFLHWLDGLTPQSGESEISVAQKLADFRQQGPGYRGPSFATIAGFAGNGAIVHYHATPANYKDIDQSGLLLVDSGGQYDNGTTDITRTVAIGEPSAEMKESFTQVLRGHIALASAKFPAGTTGAEIDMLARQFLRSAVPSKDYDHGTGHGVGCYLSVHEEAAGISKAGRNALQTGMLLSNEPGYYKKDEYGIRIESLVLVRDDGVCPDTDTLMHCFETVTFAPISKKLIDVTMLSSSEKQWLNEYHAQVYQNISPALDADQQRWLKDSTAPIL
ncbi:MAG: Xaa-Pro aminopeptidase [Micavibrio sp.]|nr:Xaa-Pro aminopeptidase [Micavibrio sp.]